MRRQASSTRSQKTTAYRYPAERLHDRWDRLHRTDREPWPSVTRLEGLASKHAAYATWLDTHGGSKAVAQALQEAWRAFHAGDFRNAIAQGSRLGALGTSVANKAIAVESLYSKRDGPRALRALSAAAERGEEAVELLPQYANAHYTLALVLGRYGQRLSIVKALAEGIAGRVRTHLERTLELEPRHAEAHVAFGLYHAEIVSTLGGLVASLTYGASADSAVEHFRQAAKLAPQSPIVHMEHAHGLLLLDAKQHREKARRLYEKAAACTPEDAMEQRDVERATFGLPR